MKRIIALAWALLWVLGCGGALADHAVEPTVEESFAEAPREEFYLMEEGVNYAVGYVDPTLEIHITEGRYLDTNWMAARIKVAYPAQLRTCMYADRYGAGPTQGQYVMQYAEKKNAVFAINDDWFMSEYRQNQGVVIRQGVNYRMRCRGNYDILGIDDQGDFHIFHQATNEDIENFEGTLVNTFVFGPAVVENGEAQPVTVNLSMGAFSPAQRIGIGQIGPLEYICVYTAGGNEDPTSKGLTLEQLGELVASFGDVQVFYNLDGGTSATMAFRGIYRGNDLLWTKINSNITGNSKTRQAGGCIYFTSAWVADAEGTGE